MKYLIFTAIMLFSFQTLFAQTKWKNDKAHSRLSFEISHFSVSDVTGLFKNFVVTIETNKADFSDAIFTLNVDIASINTEVEARDKDLRSDNFFDVAKYPKMTFKSTSIKKVAKDKYKLTGNLTMHNITKTVTMDLWYRGTVEHPQTKEKVAGFQLSGTLKRSDFKIGSKYPTLMIGNEVNIKADGEFHVQ